MLAFVQYAAVAEMSALRAVVRYLQVRVEQRQAQKAQCGAVVRRRSSDSRQAIRRGLAELRTKGGA